MKTRYRVSLHTAQLFATCRSELARAQVSIVRWRLLKISANVRRVVTSLTSTFPLQPLFAHVLANLQGLSALALSDHHVIH